MVPMQACLFKIREDGRVQPELDRETFIEAVRDCRVMEMKIVGRRGSSLITINEVAEFFDVKADWQYEWEFRENEWIDPDVLIAVIQAW